MSRHAYIPETDLWRGVPEDEKQRLLTESRGPLALAVVFSFYGASVLIVALRMYTRIWITNRTGLDDWLMVASMAFMTAVVAFVAFQVQYGDGRHIVALTTWNLNNIARMNYPACLLWTIANTTAKISILLQLLRLLVSRLGKILIWSLGIIATCANIVTFIITLVSCIPIRALWTPELNATAKCIDAVLFWKVQTIWETCTCFCIIGLLIPPLWQLRLSRGRRIGIIVLFSLSTSVRSCIASVMRGVVLFDSQFVTANQILDSAWTSILCTIYAQLEILLGVICASLPAILPLVAKLLSTFSRSGRFREPNGPRPVIVNAAPDVPAEPNELHLPRFGVLSSLKTTEITQNEHPLEERSFWRHDSKLRSAIKYLLPSLSAWSRQGTVPDDAQLESGGTDVTSVTTTSIAQTKERK